MRNLLDALAAQEGPWLMWLKASRDELLEAYERTKRPVEMFERSRNCSQQLDPAVAMAMARFLVSHAGQSWPEPEGEPCWQRKPWCFLTSLALSRVGQISRRVHDRVMPYLLQGVTHPDLMLRSLWLGVLAHLLYGAEDDRVPKELLDRSLDLLNGPGARKQEEWADDLATALCYGYSGFQRPDQQRLVQFLNKHQERFQRARPVQDFLFMLQRFDEMLASPEKSGTSTVPGEKS